MFNEPGFNDTSKIFGARQGGEMLKTFYHYYETNENGQ
jgi:hypothetical protein